MLKSLYLIVISCIFLQVGCLSIKSDKRNVFEKAIFEKLCNMPSVKYIICDESDTLEHIELLTTTGKCLCMYSMNMVFYEKGKNFEELRKRSQLYRIYVNEICKDTLKSHFTTFCIDAEGCIISKNNANENFSESNNREKSIIDTIRFKTEDIFVVSSKGGYNTLVFYAVEYGRIASYRYNPFAKRYMSEDILLYETSKHSIEEIKTLQVFIKQYIAALPDGLAF